jgi:hypothetical protein
MDALFQQLLEDLADVLDVCMGWQGVSQIDASRRNEQRLRLLRSHLDRVARIRDATASLPNLLIPVDPSFQDRARSLHALASAVYAELWQVVHTRERPAAQGPRAQFMHASDVDCPKRVEQAAHFANLAHQRRRLVELDLKRGGRAARRSQQLVENRQVPQEAELTYIPLIHSSASSSSAPSYNPRAHEPKTNCLLKQFQLVHGNEENQLMKNHHEEEENNEISVDDAVSWLRVRFIDTMLMGESSEKPAILYRKQDLRPLLEQLLLCEQRRLDGSTRGTGQCHGRPRVTYPLEEVRLRIMREFALE